MSVYALQAYIGQGFRVSGSHPFAQGVRSVIDLELLCQSSLGFAERLFLIGLGQLGETRSQQTLAIFLDDAAGQLRERTQQVLIGAFGARLQCLEQCCGVLLKASFALASLSGTNNRAFFAILQVSA
ncbi:hypothetical protein D3C85_1151170 [compost metagenome]